MNPNLAQLYYQNKALILFSTLALSFLINKFLIRSKKIGQPISTSLSWHMHKQGTPTMGGIGIIGSFFAASYILVGIPSKIFWIYGVSIASFIVGLLDDLHKTYYQDNRGLGKLDKLWIMLSLIGAIFFAQYGKYPESAIFAIYLPAVVFNTYVKNRLLKRFISLFIAFCWWNWTSTSGLENRLIALFIAILPTKCGILSLGIQKMNFFDFLMIAGLGSCGGRSSRRCFILSSMLCASAAYRALFLGQTLSVEILPVISVAVTIFFAAAFDLLDGLDGLLASISCIIFLTFNTLLLPSEQIFLALFGAICGFLILNIRPASIFMGDCGSLALGSIFGANLIALWVGTFGATLPLLSIIKLGSMLAFVPLIDFASVGFNIILAKLKKPRFFFAPIHHDLEKRIGEGSTTCVLFLINLIFCISAAIIFRSQLAASDPLLFPGRCRPDNFPERVCSE